MKVTKSKQNLISVVVLGLLLMLAMPGTAFGDNRDRNDRNRRGQNNEWNKHNRKCGKFVNCHDARNGRRDGRGPRRAVSNRWRNRNQNNWAWQNRNRRNFDRNGRRLIVRRSNF